MTDDIIRLSDALPPGYAEQQVAEAVAEAADSPAGPVDDVQEAERQSTGMAQEAAAEEARLAPRRTVKLPEAHIDF